MSRLPILCYHNVGPGPSAGRFALLHVAEAKLERQLWTLRRIGLPGLSMTEGLGRLGRGAGRGGVILTFDDGYADTLTAALPLLRRYDCRAICYVVSDCIGGHNRWDDGEGRERQPLMTREQIGLWLEAGMEIGSHSCSHPWLDKLGEADAVREIRRAGRFCSGPSGSRWITSRTRSAASQRRPWRGKALRVCVGGDDAARDRPRRRRVHRLPRLIVDGRRGLASVLLQIAIQLPRR